MTYTLNEVSAALARANGQKMAAIYDVTLANQTLKERGQGRIFGSNGTVAYAKKTSHSYAHVATFSEGSVNNVVKSMANTAAVKKSRWQDRQTCISAVTEIINSVVGEEVLNQFAVAPLPGRPLQIESIALAGNYYGFETNTTFSRKVSHGTACVFILAGMLFITTSYPDRFVAGMIGLSNENQENIGDFFGTIPIA